MTTFDDREKAYEKKFAMDAELKFKAEARRNKMLAAWAAEKLGITGDALEAYTKEVIHSDFEEAGHEDVFRKVKGDFDAKGIAVSEEELRGQMSELLGQAIAEIEKTGG